VTVTYIRWRDALAHEAASMETTPATPELAELQEVGFLLAETEDIILIGMEQSGNVRPGRWRLNIPKSAIIERRDVSLDQIRKAKKKA
jgi:hypothetical protein